MNSKLLLAAAVIALAPLVAVSAEGAKTHPATPAGESLSFDALDSNKDGRISMPEASADPALVENFSSTDKNGDGYLDNDEFAKRKDLRQLFYRPRGQSRGRPCICCIFAAPLARATDREWTSHSRRRFSTWKRTIREYAVS